MTRLIHALCIVVLTAGSGAAAAAGLDPAKLAAIGKAAEAFQALGKEAYKTGTPPRESDPAVKALLDTIFDTGGLAALAPLPFSDIDNLDDWMTRIMTVGAVYTFAGTGVADPTQVKEMNEKLGQQLARNTVAFLPEMGRYFDATAQILSAMSACFSAEMAAHPANFTAKEAKDGIARERAELAQSLGGMVTTLATPGLDPAWIRDRVTVLTAAIPAAAKFITPQDRKRLHDVAVQVAGQLKDAGAKAALTSFAQAIGK